mgnify:CR=1 FL=1
MTRLSWLIAGMWVVMITGCKKKPEEPFVLKTVRVEVQTLVGHNFMQRENDFSYSVFYSSPILGREMVYMELISDGSIRWSKDKDW